LENFGQSLVAERASGAEILVDVNFNARHGFTSSLRIFDGRELYQKGEPRRGVLIFVKIVDYPRS
jgi:uncharacterized membrane protein